jgi:acetyl-CoA C-acetyltransferase
MRKVCIIGVGQTEIGEQWGKSIKELAGDAILNAITDAGIDHVDAMYIGNMLSGIQSKQEQLGALLSDWIGHKGTEAIKIEAACASGSAALRAAITGVSSGEIDLAIAVGVEKMSEIRGTETTTALATAADADYESSIGLSFVAINALIMQRYMHNYGWKHIDFAPFSINAHKNACNNPHARIKELITVKEYEKSRMVADPINLLDASPTGDGAAAVVIAPLDSISRAYPGSSGKLIHIIGSASATDTLAISDRTEATWLKAAYDSARNAYLQAGVTPRDIDLFELHDAFSIMAALSLEACGFAEPGQALRLAIDDEISIHGSIPISTMGGLKARGHPVGATGIYQIVETCLQLRGQAGINQVENARIGMAQNIGGSGSTIITHILEVR